MPTAGHIAAPTVRPPATVNVQQASGVTLLGIGVLAVGTAASRVTVHATAVEP